MSRGLAGVWPVTASSLSVGIDCDMMKEVGPLGKAIVLISEIYCSRQGEGLLTGTPSVFVRASGCNLRCWFCDTPYTSWQPEGSDMSTDEIVAQVEEWDTRHV